MDTDSAIAKADGGWSGWRGLRSTLSALSAAAIDVAVASQVVGAAALCASLRGRPHCASSSGVVGTGTGGDPSHSDHMRGAIVGVGATPNTAGAVLRTAVSVVQLGFGLAAAVFDVAAAWPSVRAAALCKAGAGGPRGTSSSEVVSDATGGSPSKWESRCNLFAQ